jgi:hypothetical protein
MNETQEQAREVDTRNCDLEQQLSRHGAAIGESAAQVEEKDGRIQVCVSSLVSPPLSGTLTAVS